MHSQPAAPLLPIAPLQAEADYDKAGLHTATLLQLINGGSTTSPSQSSVSVRADFVSAWQNRPHRFYHHLRSSLHSAESVNFVQQGSKEIIEGVHLQKGHASNSATMSTCSGSVCLSLDAEPAVVPNGSRDTDARPLVATSRPRLRGAAASPPESSVRSLDWCTR